MIHRLNYHHLRYFWAVAREGHLTRAAERLHVSQSALSAQIRRLEAELGHDLFEREGRALRLTEVGRLVLGYADSIFSLGRELMAAVESGESQRYRELRIGSVATLSRNFQDNLLSPVMGLSDVRLVLESGSLGELLQRLAVHRLDVVLSNRPASRDADHAWRCRRIARQPVCLVGHPRRSGTPFRFPEDMQGRKLVLPGHSSDIRTDFDLLCEELEIEPDVLAEVDDMAMLRLIARDTDGIALIPEVVVQDELGAGIIEKYCEVPRVYENFYAITMERQFAPPLLKTLLPDRSRIRGRGHMPGDGRAG